MPDIYIPTNWHHKHRSTKTVKVYKDQIPANKALQTFKDNYDDIFRKPTDTTTEEPVREPIKGRKSRSTTKQTDG